MLLDPRDPHVWLRGYTFSLVQPAELDNTTLISPWTGEAWAKIYRSPTRKWWPEIVPAAGEQPYPYPEIIPGSLFRPYAFRLYDPLAELPRVLLIREVELLERWTSATISRYNGATNEDTSMTPTLLQEIAALRSKAADGSITDDELRRALRIMREERMSAAARSAARKTAVAPVDPDTALAAFLS